MLLVDGTAFDDASGAARTLGQFEIVLSALFTIEYDARLCLSDPKYEFSLFGVVDLLASIPPCSFSPSGLIAAAHTS